MSSFSFCWTDRSKTPNEDVYLKELWEAAAGLDKLQELFDQLKRNKWDDQSFAWLCKNVWKLLVGSQLEVRLSFIISF